MRQRAEDIRLPTEPTRRSDIRWFGASRARTTGGRGVLVSLIVHGAVAVVVAAALTVGAPGSMVDVVEMAWIETPTAEAVETTEPVAQPRAEPLLAAGEPPRVVPAAVPPEPPAVEPITREPAVTQAEPETRETVEPLPVPPIPVAAPTPARPTPPRPRPVAHRPGPNAESAERAGATPTAASPAQAEPAPSVSPSWNDALAAWLHRNKTYPAAARFRGEQGSGQVRFTVARDGRVLAVELVNTTGSPNLDEAVRRLLDGARVPAFPADMPHAEVTVNVRINYSLRQNAASP